MKTYEKPGIQRVELVMEQAALTAAKGPVWQLDRRLVALTAKSATEYSVSS